MLAVLAVLFSVFFHGYNALSLAGDSANQIREDVTVVTADDASYLAPVENFIAGKGWRSNATGSAAYFTRTPGYGFIYFTFRSFLDSPSALFALVCFQIGLFGIAVGFIPFLGRSIGLNPLAAELVGLTVAILPMFSGFLSYTLTEGVTPALVIFFFVLLLKGYERQTKFLIFASLLLGFIILIRPPLLVLSFGFLPFLFVKRSRISFFTILVCAVLSSGPLFIWNWHLNEITGKWGGLHSIYHEDATSLYRPLHKEIWNFHKMTGQSGSDFHRSIERLNASAKLGESAKMAVDQVVQQFNQRVFDSVNPDSLRKAYRDYSEVLVEQNRVVNSGGVIRTETDAERELRNTFESFRIQYVRANPLHSMLFVPVKVYGDLAFHSNLSLYVFQKSWRGNLFMELLRALCFAIHSLSFLIFPIAAFCFLRQPGITAISIPVLVYLAYLALVQRGIEERYTLPFLVPMFLLSALFLHRIIQKLTTSKKQPLL
ncbi:MAG: hypothetical protein ABR574_02475 [Cryomorphaceae bacterium]|nr:hypothetical protein [Flavobacteriales bacterium]